MPSNASTLPLAERKSQIDTHEPIHTMLEDNAIMSQQQELAAKVSDKILDAVLDAQQVEPMTLEEATKKAENTKEKAAKWADKVP
jgi:hypothetical protein